MVDVILIGNHPGDGNESMDRYVNLLWKGLNEKGIAAEVFKPKRFLTQLSSSESPVSKWLRYVDKFVLFPRMITRRLKQIKNLGGRPVIHICDQADAVYVSSVADLPHLVTCHDLISIRSALGEFPDYPMGRTGRICQKWILNGLRRTSAVVCVSETTQRDFRRIAGGEGQNISVIKNSLNHPYRPMSKEEAAPLIEAVFQRGGMKVRGNYLFHIGGNHWYKNRSGLVRVYKALTEIFSPPPLVLAGQPPNRELSALIQSENLQERVFAVGKVSNRELNALYSQADALVFPSLVEGFGWPVIEAQACGCPVIASDIEVIKEIAGDSACLIDASDVLESAMTIRTILSLSKRERAERIDQGFQNAATYSFSRFLNEYIDVYRNLCPDSLITSSC